MKPSQCEACRAVGPTVMCNLCPTGPRRSVQPPATPQEPELRRCGYCRVWRDKPCGLDCMWGPECPTLAEETLKARASAPPAVWQPIETAPTGTYVLAFWQRFGCYEVVKLDPAKGWIDEDDSDYVAPSHWMPLPSPPTPGGK